MNDMEKMLVERACERLVTRYCHFVDHGEAEKIAGQFTDDGWRFKRREIQVSFSKAAAATGNA